MCAEPCTDVAKCTKLCVTQDPCDCDGDGYYLNTPACATKATSNPAMYKGLDCYDCNASAHPTQMAFFDADRGDGSFDYNCDAQTEHEFTATGCGAPSGSACPTSTFFQTDPGCGQMGASFSCTYNVSVLTATCMQMAGPMVTQRCR